MAVIIGLKSPIVKLSLYDIKYNFFIWFCQVCKKENFKFIKITRNKILGGVMRLRLETGLMDEFRIYISSNRIRRSIE